MSGLRKEGVSDMKTLQNTLCMVLLALMLAMSASSQTKGMKIYNPRTDKMDTVKGYENSYAVCIGIDEYKYWPQLGSAASDAEAMQKKLKERSFTIKLLTNKEATRDNILSAITWLGNVAGEEDRVIIYFSGHGKTSEVRSRQMGYIIPVDCPKKDYYVNAISMSKIKDATYEIKAKHILYIMDCCYSGVGLIASKADTEFLLEMTGDPCVYMITAGKAGEEAIEVGGRGIFTGRILRGLDGEADFDKNGVISGTELGQYSRKWVLQEAKQHGRTQTPQFGRIDGEGEIVFITPSKKEEVPIEEPIVIQKLESKATLFVKSEPSGASVYVDQQMVGTTPCTVKIDAGVKGRHDAIVAVSKEGYETQRAKVLLLAGRRSEWLDIRLNRLAEPIIPERPAQEIRKIELSEEEMDLEKAAAPYVANIQCTKSRQRRGASSQEDRIRDLFDEILKETPEPKISGSAVIMKSDGYILTCHHLIAGAETIKVILNDRREFHAKCIGTDNYTNMAVIKIDVNGLPTTTLGDSDRIRVGDSVFAIGNPSGTGHATIRGKINSITDHIEIDAGVELLSGGALVNANGEVIGINTNIGDTEDSGSAVPINTARDVMEQLIETGRIRRGWLGVQFQDIDEDTASMYGFREAMGALVILVGDPAMRAGIEIGDLIVEYNDEPIQNGVHLKILVAAAESGETVRIKVIRGRREMEFRVKLGERTDETVAQFSMQELSTSEDAGEWIGIIAEELTDELAQQFGYEGRHGVLISSVDTDGPTAELDDPPKAGDLIEEIEFAEIRDMNDFKQAMGKTKVEQSVMLRLRRGTRLWYVVIKAQK